MPKGTRERLLLFHMQALNDLQRCTNNLTIMRDMYQPVHPDIAVIVQAHIDAIEEIARSLILFEKERM